MSQRLSGKICIITGTGGSMGRAAALAFAREGASGRRLRSERRVRGGDRAIGSTRGRNDGVASTLPTQ